MHYFDGMLFLKIFFKKISKGLSQMLHPASFLVIITILYHCVMPIPILNAEISRDRMDSIVIGKWSPPKGSDCQSSFVPIDKQTSGTQIVVRISLRKSFAKVKIKFLIETPDRTIPKFNKIFYDNSSGDLDSRNKVLVVALAKIPNFSVTRYIVKVDDFTGKPPVVKYLKGNISPLTAQNENKNMFLTQFKFLWDLPEKISTHLYNTERTPEAIFKTLTIVDTHGNFLCSKKLDTQNSLSFPIWLSEDDILYVEDYNNQSFLKHISKENSYLPEYLGPVPIEGTEPCAIYDHQLIVFRQKNIILCVNFKGNELSTLIDNMNVETIIGVFNSENSEKYLIFSTKRQDIGIEDFWVATIQGKKILSILPLSFNDKWILLSKIKRFNQKYVYENIRIDNAEKRLSSIMLFENSENKKFRIISGNLNSRYPSWNIFGSKIIFVSE